MILRKNYEQLYARQLKYTDEMEKSVGKQNYQTDLKIKSEMCHDN
jgi:hypothetical protein